jgi:hypothetical protein
MEACNFGLISSVVYGASTVVNAIQVERNALKQTWFLSQVLMVSHDTSHMMLVPFGKNVWKEDLSKPSMPSFHLESLV